MDLVATIGEQLFGHGITIIIFEDYDFNSQLVKQLAYKEFVNIQGYFSENGFNCVHELYLAYSLSHVLYYYY